MSSLSIRTARRHTEALKQQTEEAREEKLASLEKKRWLSPVPGFCETCDGPIDKVFYDAKTKLGPWACMCKTCFTLGPGIGKLGQGFGQEYTQEGQHWNKTGG